jgi:hypothetical protein
MAPCQRLGPDVAEGRAGRRKHLTRSNRLVSLARPAGHRLRARRDDIAAHDGRPGPRPAAAAGARGWRGWWRAGGQGMPGVESSCRPAPGRWARRPPIRRRHQRGRVRRDHLGVVGRIGRLARVDRRRADRRPARGRQRARADRVEGIADLPAAVDGRHGVVREGPGRASRRRRARRRRPCSARAAAPGATEVAMRPSPGASVSAPKRRLVHGSARWESTSSAWCFLAAGTSRTPPRPGFRPPRGRPG